MLTGEPGVGKTALLSYAMRAHAPGTTPATTGLESEAALPYAGLGDVLGPLLGRLPDLPRPQAHALRSALAQEHHSGEISRYAVCMATLTLLTMAGDQQPVLVAVDDAHWLDQPSLSALMFAARRLSQDPVAMLLAVRDTAPMPLDTSHLDRLPIDRLDRDACQVWRRPGIDRCPVEA